MNMEKKTYKRFAEAHAPRSPILKNCFNAFWIGGMVCLIGQILRTVYMDVCGLPPEDAGTLTSVTLIFVTVALTCLGWFDKIAKVAGAGTIIPITGFANSVVSPAIDAQAEGRILGVGAKIFTISGPVLLYAVLAGAIYGSIYYVVGLF